MNTVSSGVLTDFFQPGDKVMLREKTLRTREYPAFMENKIFIVKRMSNQLNPRNPYTQRFFIADDSGNYAVEIDDRGNIINGRFDSVDFVHV